MKTKSRSGHTALLAPSLRPGPRLWGLFVFGGRDEGGEEVHKCGQVILNIPPLSKKRLTSAVV